MAEILTIKLKRNGWPEDEEPKMMDDALLVYSEGVDEDERARMEWFEYRLDGKIVKRGGHLWVKPQVQAQASIGFFGRAIRMALNGVAAASRAAKF